MEMAEVVTSYLASSSNPSTKVGKKVTLKTKKNHTGIQTVFPEELVFICIDPFW
jgi:hypothetical protein